MKRILLSLILISTYVASFGQGDVTRTAPVSPTTSAGNYNKQRIIDANLKVALTFNIPTGTSFTHNNSNPAVGNIFYNTTTNQFGVWNGSIWQIIGASDLSNYYTKMETRTLLRDSLVNYMKVSDGLKRLDSIKAVGLTVTAYAPIQWRIGGVNYQKLTNSIFTITAATPSYNRIDLLYATTSNTVLKLEGTENVGVALPPTLPNGTVSVALIYINGSTISPPFPDLSGYATYDYLNDNYFNKTDITDNYFSKGYLDGRYIYNNPSTPQSAFADIAGYLRIYSDDDRFTKILSNEIKFGVDQGIVWHTAGTVTYEARSQHIFNINGHSLFNIRNEGIMRESDGKFALFQGDVDGSFIKASPSTPQNANINLDGSLTLSTPITATSGFTPLVRDDVTGEIKTATIGGGGGVTSFNSRTGAVSPLSTDYSSFYYPLSGNPSGFLTSFSEIDPTVPSYSKSLTAFSVIKSSTDALYEPLFSKNTAFNKNFGTASNTVAEGNDSRILNGQTAFGWGNHATAGYLTSATASSTYVPYTGATGSVNLGANSLTSNANVLTGVASPAYAQGKLVYDTDNESLTFFNNDSNIGLQVGQEEWIKVVNNTGSTIANGSAVYVNGSSGGIPTIALAKADVAATTVGVGLATESIANGATGYVTALGLVRGLNTSSFSVGAVYISETTAGALTQTAPTAPNYRYRVGFVTNVNASTGTIHVTPSTASLGNGTANQVFGMNAAGTGQEVKSITGANGVIVTNGTNSIAITGDSTSTGFLTKANGLTLAQAQSAQNLETWKKYVRVATNNFNITLSGLGTFDGVTLVSGDRILVYNQSPHAGDGVYIAASGAWTRATDMDSPAEVNGASIIVKEGTTMAGSSFIQTATVVTVGTTDMTFTQTLSQGTGITISGRFVAVNTSNAFTWGAKHTFFTPTTASASINLPHGVAPTTPVNGDMWSTTANYFVRTNGTTKTLATLESPTFVTPTLGAATATSINKVTVTAPTTSATLTLVTGSSLITSGANALTLTTTGATNATFPTGTGTLGYQLSGSASLNFPSTSANSTNSLTITVTGAVVGDVVSLGLDVGTLAITGNYVFTGYVSAADTVTIKFDNNNPVTAIDPAAATFKVKVLK